MNFTATLPVQRKIIPDAVLGMIFLLASEMMFFSGLISAFIINRAGVSNWPPLGQPRLPVEITAVNTVILLLSAFFLFLSSKKKTRDGEGDRMSGMYLAGAILLGASFLCIQGMEWVKLLGFGLTSSSSIYGAFFYTIIGAHGLHVLAGLIVLLYFYFFRKNESVENNRLAFSLYWYFVVGVWPVLYYLVYLY